VKPSEAATISGLTAVGAFVAVKNGLIPQKVALYGAGAIITLTLVAYTVDYFSDAIKDRGKKVLYAGLFFPFGFLAEFL
jgi:hypothetical protein